MSQMQPYCFKCGAELDPEAIYCPSCGRLQRSMVVRSVQPATPADPGTAPPPPSRQQPEPPPYRPEQPEQPPYRPGPPEQPPYQPEQPEPYEERTAPPPPESPPYPQGEREPYGDESHYPIEPQHPEQPGAYADHDQQEPYGEPGQYHPEPTSAYGEPQQPYGEPAEQYDQQQPPHPGEQDRYGAPGQQPYGWSPRTPPPYPPEAQEAYPAGAQEPYPGGGQGPYPPGGTGAYAGGGQGGYPAGPAAQPYRQRQYPFEQPPPRKGIGGRTWAMLLAAILGLFLIGFAIGHALFGGSPTASVSRNTPGSVQTPAESSTATPSAQPTSSATPNQTTGGAATWVRVRSEIPGGHCTTRQGCPVSGTFKNTGGRGGGSVTFSLVDDGGNVVGTYTTSLPVTDAGGTADVNGYANGDQLPAYLRSGGTVTLKVDLTS